MIMSLLASVESRMRASIGQDENIVCRAAHHHLEAGGSRVRASLCLSACLRLELPPPDAITLATICELLHNASLIHDDLMDRAALRRELPSVWVAFNDGVAICAGDLLLANALALVGELRSVEHVRLVLALVHRRTQEVILGQGQEQTSALDTLEQYERVAIGKSASLLSLPLELPLLISGNEPFLNAAANAAKAFATAYQMIDDLADYSHDLQNRSINVISVVQAQGNLDYESACALVRSRAEELIDMSIEGAARLPMQCGAAMIAHAEEMRSALRAHHPSSRQPMEPAHHVR